jgi:hypothetical protein
MGGKFRELCALGAAQPQSTPLLNYTGSANSWMCKTGLKSYAEQRAWRLPAYMATMAPRLKELRRVLNESGSILYQFGNPEKRTWFSTLIRICVDAIVHTEANKWRQLGVPCLSREPMGTQSEERNSA